MSSSRSSGRNGSASPRLVGPDALDRELHLEQRVGVETLQSEPMARTAPAARSERNGYCQRQRSPRNGMVSSSIWPSWQAHSGWALAATSSSRKRADVVGMDDLDVGDVRPRVGRAVGRAGGLDGVERLADRAVADGVEVRLEAERVERGHPGLEALRVDLDRPRLSVVPPWPSRYGSSIAPVKFSRTPSIISLTLVGLVAPDRRRLAALDELLDLLGAAVTLPPHRARRRGRSARRARPARRRRAPPSAGSTMASCQAVMPSEWRYAWPRRRASSRSAGVSSGSSRGDEVHRALVERAGRRCRRGRARCGRRPGPAVVGVDRRPARAPRC